MNQKNILKAGDKIDKDNIKPVYFRHKLDFHNFEKFDSERR